MVLESPVFKEELFKTTEEACGITIEGQNKWVTLIQNASKHKNCGVDEN
jgi:hypothetical protein